MGGGDQRNGNAAAIPVEDAFSWMFRPPVTREQTDAWFQPPAQPSALPEPTAYEQPQFARNLGRAVAEIGPELQGMLNAPVELSKRAMDSSLSYPKRLSAVASAVAAAAQLDPLLPHATKAHHGSPHSFSKFDLEKVGTGEGAQAYGHGFYFAESPEVAKFYADSGGPRYKFEGRPLGDVVRELPHSTLDLIRQNKIKHFGNWLKDNPESNPKLFDDVEGMTISEINDSWEKMLPNIKALSLLHDYGPHARRMTYGQNYPLAEETRAALDSIEKSGKLDKGQANVYSVDLKPKETEWLDWEKPLSEQSQHVQDTLSDLSGKIPGITEKALGKDIYRELSTIATGASKSYNAPSGSAALLRMGIKGIRYPDAMSRGEGKGQTNNYVVFHPDDIQITHKNGEVFNAVGEEIDQ